MSGLSIEGVCARYGRTEVVSDVSLTVERGALLAVLGPSGGGKTTLLRVVAGLHPASAGRVVADGRDLTALPPERRGVGLVPQEGALFPHLSVARNVGYGLVQPTWRSMVRQKSVRHRRVAELLDLVGLAGTGQRKPSQLSGGQQQRIALARALAPNPSVVLLDEPFSALDAGLRASLRAEVRTLLRDQEVASVLVTHDQAEALAIADTVAVMLGGRVAQVGTPEEVYRWPATLEVGAFVGDSVVLDADADGDRAHTVIGAVPLAAPAHGKGHVLVRPEQVQVAAADEPSKFTVLDIAFGGALTEVRVTGAGQTIRAQRAASHDVQAGDPVTLRVGVPVPFYPDRPAGD
ncbi:ferric iron ABC transporter ATP-binding protein [Rhodococcus aetherivorans]|uniref:Ferric iron ABC transporter ATP-binding protein n=1 Tax=Rhodococcus aetherivorans TaxID=191292 RepID=A0ABQ0YPJ1_9NOCA|nr:MULTISPECIES: ABC transporter ATP-binding protein [Rhodococcus]ETT24793.1 Fe(3+)-transporting ATPase [Rhodococcus rhodochrous ATCC 21198]MBC2588375.1 ABC transporter ATP-binding protein [Rhodococcus aetherivorans]NGP26752.1 ABC transporter ATP-binding protein [Rhodococcus aetherivorans]UGQ43095.1 ABC transporter ATP-binding protein [Rhodococcus aetherivorans]USC13685.1 ABC transporter ATP-binding protein [Rhodococcus sp. 11-3]